MEGVMLRDRSWELAELGGRRAEDHASHLLTRNRLAPHDLREAAQEFEAYFIAQMLKVMRETVPTGLFENKTGRLFYSFYDLELGRLAAQAGGLGLARLIETHYARNALESFEKKSLKFEVPATDIQTGRVNP